MTIHKIGVVCLIVFCSGGASAFAQLSGPGIVHDAEYYILEAQHVERWRGEDAQLQQRLTELRKKHGTPPNIVHIMWGRYRLWRRWHPSHSEGAWV